MEQQYCNGKLFVLNTVNVERFAELMIRGFSPMKLFAETFAVPWSAMFII